MPYTIEMLEGGKAMLVSNSADFDFATEGATVIQDVMGRLEALSAPIFYIVDLRGTQFTLDETTAFINVLARGDNPLLHHRNIREVIYIVGGVFHEMVAQGMDSDAFGNLKIRTYGEMEKALDYIRSQP